MSDAVASIDGTERLELYGKIQAQVADDQPGIYMYHSTQLEVRRTWLMGSGIEWNPMYGYYWYHIWKDFYSQ